MEIVLNLLLEAGDVQIPNLNDKFCVDGLEDDPLGQDLAEGHDIGLYLV